ncbi:copia protein [Tanacetum coccineum]
MTTLAEHIIIVGAENRPPMLEKSMYDSWESRICLFIKGKKHGRMMLDSIDNGPLVYPTVEENGQTRPKKYSDLTETQQLQDDCDVQETNIILHGLPPDVMTMQQVQVNTKFLNALPSEWSKFITDVKLAKSLYTTNYDQLYAYLSQHERHANEVRNRGNSTTSKGNVAVGPPRVVKCYNCQGEGHMARQCTQLKRPSPTNVADEAVNKDPSMQLKKLMDFCTKLQERVLDLENTKTAQAQEITSLKLRVKKLEKKGGSRTHKLKRLYKGRKIHDIDVEDITLENGHDAEMFDVNDLHGDKVFVEKEVHVKEVSDVGKVNTASIATTVTTTKGILLQEPSESITTTTTIPSKDKGKVRLTRGKDEASVAMIEERDDIQAKIDVDYQMAKQMQVEEQEELSIEEKSKLFVQLLEARKKHFAAIMSKKMRNKPPDKSFNKGSYYVYLPEEIWQDEDQKTLRTSEVRADGSETREDSISKRAGDELEQENAKKQKVDDNQEAAKMKELMKIVPDEKEVAFDVIPLATKPPSIIDWKIVKEGKISYYQIIRANGSSKRYSAFIQMLRSFDKEDLETLRYSVEEFTRKQKKRYPLTPVTITEMLNKKLQADHWNEMYKYQVWGRIVGIKRLLVDLRVTAAKVCVTVAKHKLVLVNVALDDLRVTAAKLLLLVFRVNTAGIKVTTAERLRPLK